ncbi:MAG: DoxX family membrane protein [Lunatimonas sp.]|uniref:DoxX family protein n=1 Tax=Lunatimonas sp. TaxID=2060141 RepID=UPI00263BE1F2|nr:DoxX family membrane protein [Lunatimonas sp.]MCC5939144.1 DoxX family membrane protein [Lunatimonas sp.]
MNPISFLFIRLGIGVSMLGHGLVRLPKLTAFSDKMVADFADSMLPVLLVRPFSLAIPFVEFALGVLLLLGFKSTWTAVVGATFMLLLMLGTAAIENWGAYPSQMIHLGFFVLLIQFMPANTFSLDVFLSKNKS